MPRRRPLPAIHPILLLALLFPAGCAHEPDGPTPANRSPHVQLTGGPADGDSAEYRSTFYWHGWDDDGIVDHYRYAMINLVERPSIGGPDDIPAADWRDTLSTRASFVLRSPHPLDGDEELVQQSSLGHHLFAIQAIDDHGDSSNIDWLSITSRNVLPRTTIEYPTLPVEAGLVQFREAVEIRWTGFDPDSPDPDRMPAAYEWKVIPLPQNIPAFTVDVHYAITTTPGPL